MDEKIKARGAGQGWRWGPFLTGIAVTAGVVVALICVAVRLDGFWSGAGAALAAIAGLLGLAGAVSIGFPDAPYVQCRGIDESCGHPCTRVVGHDGLCRCR